MIQQGMFQESVQECLSTVADETDVQSSCGFVAECGEAREETVRV